MVAYSFKKQFIEPIERGTKRQTIRAHRKRHARPGEPMQIYFGMRTKHCRKIIDDPICKSVRPISMEVAPIGFGCIHIEGVELSTNAELLLAELDGFASLNDMHTFWLANHGAGTFEGVIIKWEPA